MKPFIAYIAAILLFTAPAYGQAPGGRMPRNISIEVEFKESGSSTRKIGVLRPYQKTKSSKYTKQHIVVSDGLTARIRVGEDVPYIEYYERFLTDSGYVDAVEVDFREIGTKLVVTPRIRGNYIEISLAPEISYISGGNRDVINIQEMTTTVLAASGQSVSIGGLFKDKDFSNYFFKSEARSNLDIILTPRIQ